MPDITILCPHCETDISDDVESIIETEGPFQLDESFECGACEETLFVAMVNPLVLECEFEDDSEDDDLDDEDDSFREDEDEDDV